MKGFIKIVVIAMVFVAVSCQDKAAPNYQYMPDMHESVGYETYGEAAFPNGIQAQLPAEGTIPRGFVPFDIENSTAGYNLAKETLTNPLDSTEVDFERGKVLYDIYCGVCHGDKGAWRRYFSKKRKNSGHTKF